MFVCTYKDNVKRVQIDFQILIFIQKKLLKSIFIYILLRQVCYKAMFESPLRFFGQALKRSLYYELVQTYLFIWVLLTIIDPI
jgi:hypothetical protein